MQHVLESLPAALFLFLRSFDPLIAKNVFARHTYFLALLNSLLCNTFYVIVELAMRNTDTVQAAMAPKINENRNCFRKKHMSLCSLLMLP